MLQVIFNKISISTPHLITPAEGCLLLGGGGGGGGSGKYTQFSFYIYVGGFLKRFSVVY
jgi:hypothetical protein